MAAGMAFCLFGTILTGIIIWGPWSKDSEHFRLILVGGALASYFLGSITVIISLSIGGPVGRYKVTANKEGVDIEAEGHTEAQQPDYVPPAPPAPVVPNGPHVGP